MKTSRRRFLINSISLGVALSFSSVFKLASAKSLSNEIQRYQIVGLISLREEI